MARPKGSQNRDYAHAIAYPARCPSCGSTAATVVDTLPTQEYHGLDPAGNPCTHVDRRRMKCHDCPQFYVTRTYRFAPKNT